MAMDHDSAGSLHTGSEKTANTANISVSLASTPIQSKSATPFCSQASTRHHHSIVCLPSHLRERIYDYVGIFGADCFINLVKDERWDDRVTWICYNARALLLTCKVFYDECSRAFYSRNHFILETRFYKAFDILHAFRPQTIACLKQLTIHIPWDVLSPRDDPRSLCLCNYPGLEALQRPKIYAVWRNEILQACNSTMTYVLRHADSLKLYFLCEVMTQQDAVVAIRPLSTVNNLAQCTIRLHGSPNPGLSKLARAVGLHAEGKPPDTDQPFRYLDLPPELRTQILQHTDLVTPFLEVEWNPRRKYSVRFAADAHSYQAIWVAQTGSWVDPRSPNSPGCGPQSTAWCFCLRGHAGYNSQCHCWRPPGPLFLVCRTMTEEARTVFVQMNRFIITPIDGVDEEPRTPGALLEASLFLTTAISASALAHLRFLEIVIPPFKEDYFPHRGIADENWRETIAWAQNVLHLPRLTLRIYMWNLSPGRTPAAIERARMTEQQCLIMLSTYLRILRPFKNARGLQNFYLHATPPLCWTPSYRRRNRLDPTFDTRNAEALARQLTVMIMGQHSDELREGEDVYAKSQWLLDIKNREARLRISMSST